MAKTPFERNDKKPFQTSAKELLIPGGGGKSSASGIFLDTSGFDNLFDEDVKNVQDAMDIIDDASFTSQFNFIAIDFHAIIQGTWSLSTTAQQFLAGFILNTTDTLNDELCFEMYITPGTYSLSTLISQKSDGGICTVTIGPQVGPPDVTIGTIDFYKVSQTFNIQSTLPNFVVTQGKLAHLCYKMTGAGTGGKWTARITHVSLRRVA